MAEIPASEEALSPGRRRFTWEQVTEHDHPTPVDLGKTPRHATFVLAGDPGEATFRLETGADGRRWGEAQAPDGWRIALQGAEVEVEVANLQRWARPKRSGASPGMRARVILDVHA